METKTLAERLAPGGNRSGERDCCATIVASKEESCSSAGPAVFSPCMIEGSRDGIIEHQRGEFPCNIICIAVGKGRVMGIRGGQNQSQMGCT